MSSCSEEKLALCETGSLLRFLDLEATLPALRGRGVGSLVVSVGIVADRDLLTPSSISVVTSPSSPTHISMKNVGTS